MAVVVAEAVKQILANLQALVALAEAVRVDLMRL
jgi:hypothetical protein